jgi:hypothetical protein
MHRRTFSVTVETNDTDSDLIPRVPAIIRERLDGTAIRIVDITTDLTASDKVTE